MPWRGYFPTEVCKLLILCMNITQLQSSEQLMKVELRQCQTDPNGQKLILDLRFTHLCLEEHQEGRRFKGKGDA